MCIATMYKLCTCNYVPLYQDNNIANFNTCLLQSARYTSSDMYLVDSRHIFFMSEKSCEPRTYAISELYELQYKIVSCSPEPSKPAKTAESWAYFSQK